MSAALHLARMEDAEKALALLGAAQAERGLHLSEEARLDALHPLLEGAPHGALYLIGMRRAPLGFIALSFGWSLELGALRAQIEELYIREALRGRGLASEALVSLCGALSAAGVGEISLHTGPENGPQAGAAQRLCKRAKFTLEESGLRATRRF